MGEVLIGGTCALLICVFAAPRLITYLRGREFGQQIREEGPAGHHAKAGTPTMGGVLVFISIAVPFLVLTDWDWRAVAVFGTAVACALLGFADDYSKIVRRRSLGLRGRTKMIVLLLISLALWWVATHKAGLSTTVQLRFVDISVDLGLFFPVVVFLVIAGSTNAVNLSDGLDGLAGGCVAIVMLAYVAITFITTGDRDLALSVIIQVSVFQSFRKRVFLMAPIHHHFEMLGWSETKIILRFWIIAAVCSAIGFTLYQANIT